MPCRMIELIGDFFRSAVKPPLLPECCCPGRSTLEQRVAVLAGIICQIGDDGDRA